jgi:hypothetical protein
MLNGDELLRDRPLTAAPVERRPPRSPPSGAEAYE